MKFLFNALFLFTLQFLSAQDEENNYANGIFQFEENRNQRIFTNWARIRQKPDVNAEMIDSLQTNHQVLILRKDKALLQLGERKSNWYKVSYQKDDKISEGYVWGGNLCVGHRNKNGYDFLFGLTKTITKKDDQLPDMAIRQNIAAVKVVDGNALIDEVTFDTGSGESLNYATFSIESNHKLQNVLFTLKATVSGEACGVAGYDQYILFKDRKLVVLPQLMNVGDADIYYHSEEFIFPNDKGGIPDAFIFKMEEMEKDEKEKERKTYSSRTYIWNGDSYKLK